MYQRYNTQSISLSLYTSPLYVEYDISLGAAVLASLALLAQLLFQFLDNNAVDGRFSTSYVHTSARINFPSHNVMTENIVILCFKSRRQSYDMIRVEDIYVVFQAFATLFTRPVLDAHNMSDSFWRLFILCIRRNIRPQSPVFSKIWRRCKSWYNVCRVLTVLWYYWR